MRRWIIPAGICLVLFALSLTSTDGHDVITTRITWNRELSRIFNERCISCHREGGTSFAMTTYAEARPWAVAIKEEVLARRMPPWGGIKGFGEFRNDQSLTAEQIEMIVAWVEGGVPEGNEKDLPAPPKAVEASIWESPPAEGLTVRGDFAVLKPLTLDGIWPRTVADRESARITAEFPDGTVQPLLWLYEYKKQFGHPFLFRAPIELPAGTTISGIPPSSSLVLLPLKTAE
jgi:hypothetical protein